MLFGVIWTQWMAVGLIIGVILVTIGVVVMYFRSVVKPKYPPRSSRQA